MTLTFDGQQTVITLDMQETLTFYQALQRTSYGNRPNPQTLLMWDLEDALTKHLAGWERE